MQFKFTRRAPWQVGSRGWGFGLTSSNGSGLVLVDSEALTIACTLRPTTGRKGRQSFTFSIFDNLDAALREVRNRDTREGDYDFVISKEDVLTGAMKWGSSFIDCH